MIYTKGSIYSVSGDGTYEQKVFRLFPWLMVERRRESQKWSPLHREETTTWSIGFKRWRIAVVRRTKHFADKNWIAE